MAARSAPLRCVLRAKPFQFLTRRQLSVSPPCRTDGVFRELTDQRVQVPWVEAFRKREREGHDETKATGTPQTPEHRDLSPKKMADSYHSVVRLRPKAAAPSSSLTDSSGVDSTACARSLASGHLSQLLWTYKVRKAMGDALVNLEISANPSTHHSRLGTLFMDLDALSGIIAYKHTGGDVTTVTAAFDRITINHPLTEICDLELSGQVTYATGRSSMEIGLQVPISTEHL